MWKEIFHNKKNTCHSNEINTTSTHFSINFLTTTNLPTNKNLNKNKLNSDLEMLKFSFSVHPFIVPEFFSLFFFHYPFVPKIVFLFFKLFHFLLHFKYEPIRTKKNILKHSKKKRKPGFNKP